MGFVATCKFFAISNLSFMVKAHFFPFVTGAVNFASFPLFRLRILAKLLSAKFLHREIRYDVKKHMPLI